MESATKESSRARTGIGAWMAGNLAIQGYCLSTPERRELRLGLRFATGLCLPLVAVALVLEWPLMLGGLAGIGLIAGVGPRHPFDLLWNHAVRHAVGAPPLPPTPVRRRHAFKVGTAWLLSIAGLYGLGAHTAGLALGGVLLAACASVTLANFCVPSYAIWLYARSRAGD